MSELSYQDILRLFKLLNEKLAADQSRGELYLVGGAVMCLVHQARPATKDVDAYFRPSALMRQAAARVAVEQGLSEHWLNDGVKGFLSPKGDYDDYLELSHLKVYVAQPEYLLAMKCLASRIGDEFHDIDDIRFLLRTLNITCAEAARDVVTRYYPEERFPQKALYLLDELLQG